MHQLLTLFSASLIKSIFFTLGTCDLLENPYSMWLCVLFQAKLAFERLVIPKIYHPFICGPNNQYIQELAERTGARISVPPPIVDKPEVVVSGEKEGVHHAVQQIMKIYKEKVSE